MRLSQSRVPAPEISKESSRLESGDGNMSGHGFLLEQPKKNWLAEGQLNDICNILFITRASGYHICDIFLDTVLDCDDLAVKILKSLFGSYVEQCLNNAVTSMLLCHSKRPV